MQPISRLALLCTAIISLQCQNKHHDLSDPCLDQVPFKADFIVEQGVGDTSFPSEKIMAPGYLVLKAVGDYDSVQWTVGGAQNQSTDRNYSVYFNSEEGFVDILFIGYRKPNVACFQSEKWNDTLRKSVEVVSRNENAAIVGSFSGYNKSTPHDTFSVVITYYDETWGFFLKNLPKGCPGYTQGVEGSPANIGIDMAAGYSSFKLNASTRACSIVNGFGRLIAHDTLSIAYSYYPKISSQPLAFEAEARKEEFIGIRQP